MATLAPPDPDTAIAFRALAGFFQHLDVLNRDRGLLRVGGGLYLNVVSLVIGDGRRIRHNPYFVIPVCHDDQLRAVGNMLFVGTLLVAMGSTLRIADPTFQRGCLGRLTSVNNER